MRAIVHIARKVPAVCGRRAVAVGIDSWIGILHVLHRPGFLQAIV